MDINISDIIFGAINFLIMVGVLTFLLYKPVLKILDARKEKIEKETSEAAQLLEEVKASKITMEQELIEARRQATELIQSAAKTGEEKKQSLLDAAEEKSELLFKNTQSDLRLEKEKLQLELKEEAVGLAVTIARKLMATAVHVSSSNRVEEFVLQLSSPAAKEKIKGKITEQGEKASAEIVSCQPLSDKERALVAGALMETAGANVSLKEKTDSSLVGGSILFIGDLMFDGSVSNKLNNIGREILSN
ncbi:MAG: F0F1 ATP synthase subunit B [Oscillospiraceae bacterium]